MINIVFLMLVALVPFPAQLLAEQLRGTNAREAALAYGAGPLTVRGITRAYTVGPWVYLAATLFALASAVVYAVIAIFYMIESAIFGRPRRLRARG
jgi:uncharacterized membrane protein